MFRSAILLSLTTLALGLSTGDLKVTLNAVSTKVSSIEDIILTAVVSNPTDSDIRVIRSANVLDASASDSFRVSKDGEKVQFTGLIIQADFAVEENFVTIPAGQSIAVNHTVSNTYDFESHGTGSFTFAPWTYFQTDVDHPVLEVPVEAVTVEVTEDVAFRSVIERSTAQLRTSFPNCNDGGKLQTIRDSITYARSLAGGAAADIRNRPNSNEWNKFFGGNNRDDVWWRFDLIAGDLPSSGNRQVYCNRDDAGICNRATAYAIIWRNGNGQITQSDIYMCDGFFGLQGTPDVCRQPLDQINNSKGGVMLHEMSHATGGTTDHAYGCGAVQGLSAQQKFDNADNYQCMSLNVYRLFNC